jgi:uncharacterized membrane protein YgcG
MRPVLFALVLAGAWLMQAGPQAPDAVAQKSLIFERFHADIEVQPSGDLLITETLIPTFTGQWNGVVRILERGHTTAAGRSERLDIDILGAADEHGLSLRHEADRSGSEVEVRVWVHDARDRTAHVELRYRVRGAIRHFAPDTTGPDQPYDELYWQVTGTNWDVPIREASARVVLPPGARPLQATAYVGTPSSSRQVPVEQAAGASPATVTAQADDRIDPGEGLTVAVAWPAGHVAMPAGAERARPTQLGPSGAEPAPAGLDSLSDAAWTAWLPLLLPFLAFWVAYRAWSRRGRDPQPRAITVRWEPPAGLTPAEVGTLVDHSPHMHDIVSTLVDLAVRGYLVIEEREKKGFLKFGKDYTFHLIRPRAEWGDLREHERRFLDGLFDGTRASEVLADIAAEGSFLDDVLESVAGEPASRSAPDGAVDSVRLSDLQNEFYKEIPEIKNAILDALVDKGHYLRRPDRARTLWGVLAGVAAALSFTAIVGFAAETATGLAYAIAILVGGLTSAFILAVFAFLMPARTEQGARTREAALGFKRFLERVESPRYRRMIRSPDQFERYLPFAMAFQCEEKWAKAFDDLVKEPPDWYYGSHGAFHTSAFASEMGTLASAASSTMASSPSSSGSGGGGSVGGGSGGGGGGGF